MGRGHPRPFERASARVNGRRHSAGLRNINACPDQRTQWRRRFGFRMAVDANGRGTIACACGRPAPDEGARESHHESAQRGGADSPTSHRPSRRRLRTRAPRLPSANRNSSKSNGPASADRNATASFAGCGSKQTGLALLPSSCGAVRSGRVGHPLLSPAIAFLRRSSAATMR